MLPDPINIEASVALLRALANPARLRIVLRLLQGECAVAELEAELSLRQPNLSQHLAELRDAGLVAARRESRSVFYHLAGEGQRHLAVALLRGFGGEGGPVPEAPAGELRRARQTAVFATVAAVG